MIERIRCIQLSKKRSDDLARRQLEDKGHSFTCCVAGRSRFRFPGGTLIRDCRVGTWTSEMYAFLRSHYDSYPPPRYSVVYREPVASFRPPSSSIAVLPSSMRHLTNKSCGLTSHNAHQCSSSSIILFYSRRKAAISHCKYISRNCFYVLLKVVNEIKF